MTIIAGGREGVRGLKGRVVEVVERRGGVRFA